MGTEGQGQPLGARPVSVLVAMPLGEQMVLLAPCPLFLSPPAPPGASQQGLGTAAGSSPEPDPRQGWVRSLQLLPGPEQGCRGCWCREREGAQEGAPEKREGEAWMALHLGIPFNPG